MRNIFIEGIPGSGKSTLLKELQRRLPECHCYYEGDLSPVELAWCSYMTKEQYDKALNDWPQFVTKIKQNLKVEGSYYIVAYTRIHTDHHEFYQYMEAYELYGGRRSIEEFQQIVFQRFQRFHGTGQVFECSFFQNIIEELMLFAEYDDSKILSFYRQMIEMIQDEFMVVRLVSNDIEKSIQQIKAERVNEKGEELWYHAMMDYLNQSPYGKAHHYQTFDDLMKHFKRRMTLEKKIEDEILHNRCVEVPSKNYDIEEIIEWMEGNTDGQ